MAKTSYQSYLGQTILIRLIGAIIFETSPTCVMTDENIDGFAGTLHLLDTWRISNTTIKSSIRFRNITDHFSRLFTLCLRTGQELCQQDYWGSQCVIWGTLVHDATS